MTNKMHTPRFEPQAISAVWPPHLVEAMAGRSYLCHGGHEFDGRRIAELRKVVNDIAAHGVRSVAISSVFSPVNSEFEVRAGEYIARELPEVAISSTPPGADLHRRRRDDRADAHLC